MKICLALALCVLLASTVDAADKKKKPAEPARNAATFKKLDKDKDGKLSLDEFTSNWDNPQRGGNVFGMLDKDSNAALSEKEYLAKTPAKKK
jgi:hypothetical protein